MRSFSFLAVALLYPVALAGAGCGSADTPPLGGPYGGSSPTAVAPTQGSSGSGDNGTPGTGSADPDSGAAAPEDAGAATPTVTDAATDAGMVVLTGTPTWSQIYTAYLAPGTMGDCNNCHSQMGSASGAYAWLTSQDQLGGSSPEILSPSKSCLSWLGGNMPPNGPTSEPSATAALQAWAAAGAQNN